MTLTVDRLKIDLSETQTLLESIQSSLRRHTDDARFEAVMANHVELQQKLTKELKEKKIKKFTLDLEDKNNDIMQSHIIM